jgi:hypothetical protein
MIIADQLKNPDMMTLAQNDYADALTALASLKNALNNIVSAPGNPGTDINGNLVDPYADAIAAYNSNVVRMTGEANSLVPNSMKLSLGCVANIPTNTQVPQPTNLAPLQSTQQSNNCYIAYQDIPYDNNSFVFAGVTNSTTLIDSNLFVAAPTSLPYFLPSILKAEANQQYLDTSPQNGSKTTRVIHAVACAEPASVVDPLPAPGALTISFPDGALPELKQPGDILTYPPVATAPVNLYTPPNGDYPGNNPTVTNTPTVLQPPPLSPPTVANTWTTTVYGWLKRGGPKTNIQSVIDMQTTSLAALPAIASPMAPWLDGWLHKFEFAADGTITYNLMRMPAGALLWVSDHQTYSVTKSDFTDASLGQNFDVVVTNEVYRAGNTKGGIHGGQPLTTKILNNVANVLTSLPLITDKSQPQDYGAGGMGTGFRVYMGDDDITLPVPAGVLNSTPTKGWVGLGGAFMYRVMKLQNLALPLIPAGGCNTAAASIIEHLLNPSPLTPLRPSYTTNGAAADICFRKVKIGWCFP